MPRLFKIMAGATITRKGLSKYFYMLSDASVLGECLKQFYIIFCSYVYYLCSVLYFYKKFLHTKILLIVSRKSNYFVIIRGLAIF